MLKLKFNLKLILLQKLLKLIDIHINLAFN